MIKLVLGIFSCLVLAGCSQRSPNWGCATDDHCKLVPFDDCNRYIRAAANSDAEKAAIHFDPEGFCPLERPDSDFDGGDFLPLMRRLKWRKKPHARCYREACLVNWDIRSIHDFFAVLTKGFHPNQLAARKAFIESHEGLLDTFDSEPWFISLPVSAKMAAFKVLEEIFLYNRQQFTNAVVEREPQVRNGRLKAILPSKFNGSYFLWPTAKSARIMLKIYKRAPVLFPGKAEPYYRIAIYSAQLKRFREVRQALYQIALLARRNSILKRSYRQKILTDPDLKGFRSSLEYRGLLNAF